MSVPVSVRLHPILSLTPPGAGEETAANQEGHQERWRVTSIAASTKLTAREMGLPHTTGSAGGG